MSYGEILKKTRTESRLSQEKLAEHLYCHRSVISKLENDTVVIDAERMIHWLAITKRLDIFILLVNGMEPAEVLKKAFSKEYKSSISNIKFPSFEQIEENLKNLI